MHPVHDVPDHEDSARDADFERCLATASEDIGGKFTRGMSRGRHARGA